MGHDASSASERAIAWDDAAILTKTRSSGVGSAFISQCGTFRYSLTRTWDEGLPICVWVMLNPSTADGTYDDATIRKCVGFAKRWGFGGIEVVNLWAYRATSPADLRRAVRDWEGGLAAQRADLIENPRGGVDNETALMSACYRALDSGGQVIFAWGAHAASIDPHYERHCAETLMEFRPKCLGTTKGGAPRHPLMLRYDTPLDPCSSLTYGIARQR